MKMQTFYLGFNEWGITMVDFVEMRYWTLDEIAGFGGI